MNAFSENKTSWQEKSFLPFWIHNRWSLGLIIAFGIEFRELELF